jgi:hypothetical protein
MTLPGIKNNIPVIIAAINLTRICIQTSTLVQKNPAKADAAQMPI